ncbi:hypothetical protein FACS18942_02900 [Planctomycetales bacterium]|nr:hypothetical protein FACS18942_02900 [Planctomycetales bacterium]GHT35087.1 hypothetical protein FACS189427_03650 [Planctomycetales bacterium]
MKCNNLSSYFLISVLIWFTGCEILPVTRFKPTLHNPFPELTNVAVVPFYNESSNGNVNGREFALYYANELQRVPGFRVISNELVEKTMLAKNLQRFENVEDLRYLATLLNVDVVVIGKLHDFSGYYPPRLKLETNWYAKNPYLHPIPIGYGLPWGTEYEEFIPDKVALLAEKELATAQIQTQTPEYEPARSPEERRKQEQLLRSTQNGNGFNNNSNGKLFDKVPKFRQKPEPPLKQSKKENPIRLAAAVSANDDESNEISAEVLTGLTEQRQERFVQKNLETTGVPHIPDAVPLTPEEQQERAMNYDRNLPHPFHNGPWESVERNKSQNMPLQNPWSGRNPYPLYQQGQQDGGNYAERYTGHYSGKALTPQQLEMQKAEAEAPQQFTPEQLAHYAQFGWIPQEVKPVQNTAREQYAVMPGMPVEGQAGMIYGEPESFPGLPKDWPDPRGFIPEGPQPERVKRKIKSDAPVLTHINLYQGNDSEFMQALEDYDFLYRDDKRLAGKQSILNNRSEFIAFCCRLHIWEMLTTRGGAGPAEKVSRTWKLWDGGERPY